MKQHLHIIKKKYTAIIKNGPFGEYISIRNGKFFKNYPLPKDYDLKNINHEYLINILKTKNNSNKKKK